MVSEGGIMESKEFMDLWVDYRITILPNQAINTTVTKVLGGAVMGINNRNEMTRANAGAPPSQAERHASQLLMRLATLEGTSVTVTYYFHFGTRLTLAQRLC